MLEAQSRQCAICKAPVEALVSGRLVTAHIDHDHATGQVRGLLCHGCNSGLGYFKDDPELLFQAMCYLAQAQKSTAA